MQHPLSERYGLTSSALHLLHGMSMSVREGVSGHTMKSSEQEMLQTLGTISIGLL